MAIEDLKKFQKLLISDADFQEKLRKAGEAYTGEQDEKSVYNNLLLPLAKEYGLSATYEEFEEYISGLRADSGELSDDELEQVAGGKISGGGAGAVLCKYIGGGVGAGGTSDTGGGACVAIGFGYGNALCLILGEGAPLESFQAFRD